MKKHLSFLVVSILTVALSAWGQSGNSGSAAPDNSAQTGSSSGSQGSMGSQAGSQASAGAGNQQVLEGCIIRDERDYYLEPLNGQEVRLHGSNVSQHVNHHVQVKGTEQAASNSSANSGAMAGQASSTTSANAPTDFLVTEVDMVSESCPANLKHRHANSGSQTPGTGSTQGNQAEPK
jgi:hypothetical protein